MTSTLVPVPKANPIAAALLPLSIVRTLWKRKVSIALIWVAVSSAAFIVVARIPSVYKADALIVVDSQKIPERYVSSTVGSDAEDRVASISHQILSTGQLQKIIEDFDLYHVQRQSHYIEEVLALMRNDIEVTPERASLGHSVAFRISYQGASPSIVAKIANRIANLYVEENLRTREVQAAGTAEFIESQLKDAKQKLDDLEAAVSRYKLSHNGELPQQEGSLNGILGRLQVGLEANRDAINRAEQNRLMLQDALAIAESTEQAQESSLRTANEPYVRSTVPGVPDTRRTRKSDVLQSQLDDLRLRYSDDHPDVKRLEAELERVKKAEGRAVAAAPNATKGAGTQTGVAAPAQATDSPELQQARERIKSIKSQLALASQELEKRQTEQPQILKEIAVYQSRVNSLPIREQEMAQLTRDYEMSKLNYRSLLDKKISAEMATDMERRQKSERFTIVDPARTPVKPIKPKRALLNAGGSVFGLLLGLALAFGQELQAGTLLGEWELPKNVPILGRLPYINLSLKSPQQMGSRKRARHRKLIVVSSALLIVLGVALASLYFISHRS